MLPSRVLLVDDSATARLGISQALRKHGYEVNAVGAVEEVDAALGKHPNLILVDIQMPEMFGDDLVTWLRQKRAVKVPILLCSTRTDRELERLAGECGADGWIRKAGRPDDIAAFVDRHLDPARRH